MQTLLHIFFNTHLLQMEPTQSMHGNSVYEAVLQFFTNVPKGYTGENLRRQHVKELVVNRVNQKVIFSL